MERRVGCTEDARGGRDKPHYSSEGERVCAEAWGFQKCSLVKSGGILILGNADRDRSLPASGIDTSSEEPNRQVTCG